MGSRVFLAVLLLAACGDNGAAPPNEVPGDVGCNPLVGDDCLTPFPSSHYEVADPSTPTGVRVAIPEENFPLTSPNRIRISPAPLNGRDGFSPATPFLVYFASGVDASQLPGHQDPTPSLSPTSAVQMIDFTTGERVLLFAELDANAEPGERQALIIRPLVRLKPARRYVIALVGLRDASGAKLEPAPFKALRDGAQTNAKYAQIFTRLESAGIARADLSLAWDVTTGSDGPIIGRMEKMRDEVVRAADADELAVTHDQTIDTPDEHRLREVWLDGEAPRFLASDADDARLRLDEAGQPVADGKFLFPITVIIPKCAESAPGPLPVMIIGHGLFGTGRGQVHDRRLLRLSDQWCMVLAATDWIGLTTSDLPGIAAALLADVNKFPYVMDRLQQAHMNTLAMTRLFKNGLGAHESLLVDGRQVVGTDIFYFGISNGGIQGGAFMSLTPDVERGVLNVPGGAWSLLLFRSTYLYAVMPILAAVIPDALDRQVMPVLLQGPFDYTDPITYAPTLLSKKKILVQESVGDAGVSNIATRLLVRTLGLDGFDLVEPVAGVAEKLPPMESAYTQWNVHPEPLPPIGNTPAPKDNGAHGGIQHLPALQAQVRDFLKLTGAVTRTCGGPCDFP
jgi:hypothetical protein